MAICTLITHIIIYYNKRSAMPAHRQAARKGVDLTVVPKQQPCSVQVVEGVGLVTFSI